MAIGASSLVRLADFGLEILRVVTRRRALLDRIASLEARVDALEASARELEEPRDRDAGPEGR